MTRLDLLWRAYTVSMRLAAVEQRLRASQPSRSASALVDRVHGPRRDGALKEAVADFRAWMDADHAWPVAAAGLVIVAALLRFGSAPLVINAATGAYALLALLGLYVVVTETGQPSLGHAAFLAVGAYTTALLRMRFKIDGITATFLATAAAGAAGAALARGTSRLAPSMVALATWVFGWLVTTAIEAFSSATGGTGGLSYGGPLRVRAAPLGVDFALSPGLHLVLASLLVAMAMLLVRSAQLSPLGRAWAALRESPVLASSLGYRPSALRRWSFATGAAAAGLAGALASQLIGVVDPSRFSPLQSLALLVAVLVGSPLGVLGMFAGLAVVTFVPAALANIAGTVGFVPGQVEGIATAMLAIAGLALALRDRQRRLPDPPVTAGEAALPPTRGSTANERGARGTPLTATDLSITFGGIHALQGVSVAVRPGEIHALVGPNGSGKSTLLRCLAGAMTPTRGSIKLGNREVRHDGEAKRVGQGIARSFQRTLTLASLTPLGHVELGLNAGFREVGILPSLLKTPGARAGARALRAEAIEVLQVVGLEELAHARPESISAGRQRLLQVGSALATRPSILLLDEPSAGMRPDEIRLLARAVRIAARSGIGVLLVEHNMRFVMELADRVTVLREGLVIASGTPAEVVANAEVQRAYLGHAAARVSDATSSTRRSKR
jgi:ABC-type branched-subunit amino acid transport system ATPase component/ABC-type branched-subunit amino acid transport system permease subunit